MIRTVLIDPHYGDGGGVDGMQVWLSNGEDPGEGRRGRRRGEGGDVTDTSHLNSKKTDFGLVRSNASNSSSASTMRASPLFEVGLVIVTKSTIFDVKSSATASPP